MEVNPSAGNFPQLWSPVNDTAFFRATETRQPSVAAPNEVKEYATSYPR